MDLKTFASKVKGATPFGGLILAFDPGETTGFCAMFDFKIRGLGQVNTKPELSMFDCYKNLMEVFADQRMFGHLEDVAIEDYRIYDWKAESHSWSQVHTIKVVGLIQLLCGQNQLEYTMRMAQVAKGFCTDQKLEMWGLYDKTKGMKHARDAVRHACYHALFSKKAD